MFETTTQFSIYSLHEIIQLVSVFAIGSQRGNFRPLKRAKGQGPHVGGSRGSSEIHPKVDIFCVFPFEPNGPKKNSVIKGFQVYIYIYSICI